ncbi:MULTISPECIES: hypothetical protein [Cupriavidus]
MLQDIYRHRSHTYSLAGRSAHGGAVGTLATLSERGWVVNSRVLSAVGFGLIGIELPAPLTPDQMDTLVGHPLHTVESQLSGQPCRILSAWDRRPTAGMSGRINVRLDIHGVIATVTVE